MEYLNEKQLHILFGHYQNENEYTRGLRSKTLMSNKGAFATFQKIMPEVIITEHLHPHVLNEFFKRLSNRKRLVGKRYVHTGIKPSTIRTYYNRLIAFFRWLENNGCIEKYSLCEKITKPPTPVYDDVKAFSETEVSKILATITTATMGNTFVYLRDVLIATLLLYTGIRKGEFLALQIQDIDFYKRSIYINGKTSKSKKSRVIPLHPLLVSNLKSYLAGRKKRGVKTTALIVSTLKDEGLTEAGIIHWVRRYKERTGINIHLHRFRHTFACSLAKSNADIVSIMNVMGHSSIKMTERYLRSIKSESSRTFIDNLSY